MAEFVQTGDAVDYTPIADVAAGVVVVQSDLVGVTKRDIKANELGALAVAGVFDVAKEGGVAVVFGAGDKVYWDDANDYAVATDGAGANKLLGKAVEAAADADTEVRVRLSQ
jgi:predicted RecA/RadA family phage recombinase